VTTTPMAAPACRGHVQLRRPEETEAIRLYRIPAAAEQLDVSERTMYRLIDAGLIRTVDISEGVKPIRRIRADDLQAYIDARTEGKVA